LAELVRKGEVLPAELVEEAIRRIEKVDPQVNAVIERMYDQARKTAAGDLPDGPFRGVPFLIKDIMADHAGVRSCRGSRFLTGDVPERDSEIVRRYKTAGVVILGKTNTPEFGLLPVTEPELCGPTNNPWDLTRTAGGSSGGSAAVAARVVPVAHGNDGGGSIRIPASCCGVFGLKPTRGRTPTGPNLAETWQGMAVNHVLSLSVRDSAAMLDATAGPEVGAPYYAPLPDRSFLEEVGAEPDRLRIAYTADPLLPGKTHPDCVKGLEETVKLCQELGHEMVEAAPKVDGSAFARAFLTVICRETRAGIREAEPLVGRKATSADFETVTWALNLLGQQFNAGDFAMAVRTLKDTAHGLGYFFEDHDMLLTPTVAMPPPVAGALQPRGGELAAMKLLGRLNAGRLLRALVDPDALAADTYAFIACLPPFNASGQPAMSVPLYWNDEGLPIGMQSWGTMAARQRCSGWRPSLSKQDPGVTASRPCTPRGRGARPLLGTIWICTCLCPVLPCQSCQVGSIGVEQMVDDGSQVPSAAARTLP
jgi:amidase